MDNNKATNAAIKDIISSKVPQWNGCLPLLGHWQYRHGKISRGHLV